METFNSFWKNLGRKYCNPKKNKHKLDLTYIDKNDEIDEIR